MVAWAVSLTTGSRRVVMDEGEESSETMFGSPSSCRYRSEIRHNLTVLSVVVVVMPVEVIFLVVKEPVMVMVVIALMVAMIAVMA